MLVETKKVESTPTRTRQRILARVPLCVSGKVNDEVPFEEQSFTTSVNVDGGLILLRKPVRKGQRLNLYQVKTGQKESCIVAHVEVVDEGFVSVRVQFLAPNPKFWHISFPPDDWTPRHPDSKFNRQSQNEAQS